ncbi:MAG: branched-chain-amino-acid transaminase [Planctomycetota bacterium]
MTTTPAAQPASPHPASAPVGRTVWLDGDLVPQADANISVFDHGVLYGDGVFEGIRIYNGRVFKLDTHLRRLFASALSLRLDIGYTIEELAAATRATVDANGLTNGYIRLCVTRGNGPLGINPFLCEKSRTFIIAASIKLYPEQMYREGMSIITAATVRNHAAALSPRIKSLNYLNNIMAKIEAVDAGVPEAVMLNPQGFVAECTGDNLFIVRDSPLGSAVVTPPLHAGILEGVTRNEVMKLAHNAGYTVVEQDLTRHDLYVANELFLTGSAAEVIAVTKVDGRVIGQGVPGPITNDLIGRFRALVANDAPED